MNLLIVLGVFFLVFFIIAILLANAQDKESEREYVLWKNALENRYGTPTLEINPSNNCDNTILVYDRRKAIIINSKVYRYSDIIDFNVNDQTSYKTTSSTGSIIGRGVVGGLLFGGVGALAGAATGGKNTTKKVSLYRINIVMRNMSNPIITYVTYENEYAQKMIAVLKNIIDYNEKIRK